MDLIIFSEILLTSSRSQLLHLNELNGLWTHLFKGLRFNRYNHGSKWRLD